MCYRVPVGEVNPCLPEAAPVETPTTEVGLFPRGNLVGLKCKYMLALKDNKKQKKATKKKVKANRTIKKWLRRDTKPRP